MKSLFWQTSQSRGVGSTIGACISSGTKTAGSLSVSFCGANYEDDLHRCGCYYDNAMRDRAGVRRRVSSLPLGVASPPPRPCLPLTCSALGDTLDSIRVVVRSRLRRAPPQPPITDLHQDVRDKRRKKTYTFPARITQPYAQGNCGGQA
jgi:hypothetical protein